jgi:hypothetical protein
MIDTTAPAVSLSESGAGSAVTVSATATDSLSGVASVGYERPLPEHDDDPDRPGPNARPLRGDRQRRQHERLGLALGGQERW